MELISKNDNLYIKGKFSNIYIDTKNKEFKIIKDNIVSFRVAPPSRPKGTWSLYLIKFCDQCSMPFRTKKRVNSSSCRSCKIKRKFSALPKVSIKERIEIDENFRKLIELINSGINLNDCNLAFKYLKRKNNIGE